VPEIGEVDVSRLLALTTELLLANPYGFLITSAADGQSHTRLVHHLRADVEAELWFGTSPRSRKAVEAASTRQAAYAVEDRGRFAYVVLYGPIEVIDDIGTRESMWEEGLRTFFPSGPLGDDFVLLHLIPTRVELMTFADGIHPDPYGLLPAAAERARNGWATVAADRSP
jgi:general stress protein 26